MSARAASAAHRFAAPLERSDNKLWGAHVRVPGPIAAILAGKKDRRVLCSLNGKAEYQCALLPAGGGTFVVSVNKKLRDGLRLAFGSMVEVELRKDASEYGLPMPDELLELFRQDPKDRAIFHSLTKGKQRVLLYIINGVSDADRRIFRAITILRHLHMNNGAINHRQLGAALKDPRAPRLRPGRKGRNP